jgi:hypothetical protein
MTTPNGGFTPGPPVSPLPKANPNAPGAQPYAPKPTYPGQDLSSSGWHSQDEHDRYHQGNFNPNVRLDPSIANVQPGVAVPGFPDHYQTGFELGQAIVQLAIQRAQHEAHQAMQQAAKEIESWFQ